MWDYRARAVTVHDGDTLTMDLDVGFAHTARVPLRLAGVWAPELAQPGGPDTRDFAQAWITTYTPAAAWPFRVTTTRVRGDKTETTTLGRYVATVQTIDGTHCLNDDLRTFLTAHPQWPGGTGSKAAR